MIEMLKEELDSQYDKYEVSLWQIVRSYLIANPKVKAKSLILNRVKTRHPLLLFRPYLIISNLAQTFGKVDSPQKNSHCKATSTQRVPLPVFIYEKWRS